MEEMLKNDRFATIACEVLNIGFAELGKKLEIPENDLAIYENFLKEFSDKVNDRRTDIERSADLSKKLKTLFLDFGFTSLADNSDAVADAVIAEYGTNEVTVENAMEFFGENEVLGENRFENFKQMARNSTEITVEKTRISKKTVTDIEREAQTLAKALSLTVDFIDTVGNTSDYVDLLDFIGPILDIFNESQLIGNESTYTLLRSMLRSNTIRDSIGLTRYEADEVAKMLYSGLAKESYTLMFKSMKSTIRMIQETGKALSQESITALLQDISPATAQVLATLSTPSVVMANGVPEKNAQAVSQSFTTLFNNMATAKENGMSDEQYEKESEAVNHFVQVAMSAGSSDNKNAFGEGSVTGTTPTGFVESVLDSQIISDTLVQTVYGDGDEPVKDPYQSERNLSAEEETELKQTLDSKWQDQLEKSESDEANEEFRKKLNSIASVLNLDYKI